MGSCAAPSAKGDDKFIRGDADFVGEMLVKYGEGDLFSLRPAMLDACRNGHTEIVGSLNKHGVDIQPADLMNAASNGHEQTVRACVEMKNFAQVELDDALSRTLLRTGSYEKIKPLLAAGADPHYKNDELWTVCETKENKQVIERLIVDHKYRPPATAEFGLSYADDEFSKHVNEVLTKAKLNDKLSEAMTEKPAIVKTKTMRMKI